MTASTLPDLPRSYGARYQVWRHHPDPCPVTADPRAAFRAAAQAARAGAGIIAARHRDDLASGDTLLDAREAAGFLFLAARALREEGLPAVPARKHEPIGLHVQDTAGGTQWTIPDG